MVPGGVLVFLPSYFLLGELKKRWRDTKIDEEIKKCKQVILEPKSGEELKHKMKEFYSAARNPKLFSDSITGAVFLGVCRGKVSEGLDFADQDARAVITVGIPFPSIKDKQVDTTHVLVYCYRVTPPKVAINNFSYFPIPQCINSPKLQHKIADCNGRCLLSCLLHHDHF